MATKKRNIVRIIGILVIAFVATGLGFWYYYQSTLPYVVSLKGLGTERANFFLSWTHEHAPGFPRKLELATVEQNQGADVVLGYLSQSELESGYLELEVPKESIEALPYSIRMLATTGAEATIHALPLALDHVELIYRRDLFRTHGLVVEDRILNLADLESVLAPQAAGDFFPLLIAGGDDQALLDAVSALVLSIEGVDAYDRLRTQLRATEGQFAAEDLALLDPVLDRLKQYRARGIIHPDWLAFSKDDVRSLAGLKLSAAVIMRLSEHRGWSLNDLRGWQSSPFPFQDAEMAGTALLAPTLYLGLVKNSPRSKELTAALGQYLGDSFQKTVVADWGLGPVHSTAEALDKEASDLRFWSAASRKILGSLADELGAASGTLAAKLRETLRTN